jgi:hypothetical protein
VFSVRERHKAAGDGDIENLPTFSLEDACARTHTQILLLAGHRTEEEWRRWAISKACYAVPPPIFPPAMVSLSKLRFAFCPFRCPFRFLSMPRLGSLSLS